MNAGSVVFRLRRRLRHGFWRVRHWLRRRLGNGAWTPGAPATLASARAQLRSCVGQRLLHPQAGEIAQRALDFAGLRVHDIMVPRKRILALPKDVAPATLRRVLLEDGYSRMPIYDGTLDNIVGILVAKDVLALAWEGQLIILQDLLQPPYFAPETMHAADLLGALQRRRQHFAVVVDELGGTAGIVTLEDLLEELVGDICGTHDAQIPEYVHHEADGTITLEGMMPVREANRELALRLPEDERFTTVGGLCVSMAGRIPEAGAQLDVGEGMVLEVVEASPRNVTRVRLQRGEGPPAATVSASPAQ